MLLGALVNVAVAWGCALWINVDWETSGPVDDDAQIVEWLDARSWESDLDGPWRPNWSMNECGFGRRRVHLWAEVISGHLPMPADLVVEVAGWPLKALEGDYVPVTGGDGIGHERAIIQLPIGHEVTPLRPIWPGFAINTVFYAFILWLLFAAPFALRRRLRIKRGLCPKCAYPVGTWGGGVCTECGAAVPLSLWGARERARVREPTQ